MSITRLKPGKLAAFVATATLLLSMSWLAAPAYAVTAAPVVTFPTTSPYTATSSPIIITGTAASSSTITITGGASTSTATTTSGGTWSASVGLNASSTNTLSITAEVGTSTSPATTIVINFNTGTSTGTSTTSTTSPTITLIGGNSFTRENCSEFQEPGFTAVDHNGATSTVNVTTSGTVSTVPGTYTITYEATDQSGHTASTTRTVTVTKCTAPSTGGGGGGTFFSSTSNPSPFITGIIFPGVVTGTVGIPATGGEVLGASIFIFTTDLRPGSSGEEVTELQTRLSQDGFFSGPITGYFGLLTKSAVMHLQRNNGLPATGILGPETRALLNS